MQQSWGGSVKENKGIAGVNNASGNLNNQSNTVAGTLTAGDEASLAHAVASAFQGNLINGYFSTKKMGSGQGLPTAKRIVEEHGGSLSVHSEPGRGSSFTVVLPTTPGACSFR